MSTTSVIEVLAEADAIGVQLRLVDGKVKAAFAAEDRARVAPVLERLISSRDEIAEALRHRGEVPPMPQGVRLISWNLKEPPIAIERCSIVTDPALYARRTLEQLEARLAGKDWLAGHWSVRELRDRLETVGVEVRVENESPLMAPAPDQLLREAER